MNIPPRSIALILILLTTACLSSGRLSAQSTELTAEQRTQLGEWITKFRHAKTSDDRQTALGEALKLGRPAAQSMLDVIRRELKSEARAYLNTFRSEAMKTARERAAKIDAAKVAELREKTLALRDQKELTKEMIVSIGDPSLAELEQLLSVKREDVLENSPRVKQDRQRMLDLDGCSALIWFDYPDLQSKQDADQEKPQAVLENLIVKAEEGVMRGVILADGQSLAVMAENEQLAARVDPQEAACVAECNRMRVLLGLPALALDVRLCMAARDHSKDMKEKNFFNHSSPVPGKASFTDRAKNFGVTASAENIYMGSTSGKTANDAWWHSPGHHKNMLGDHKRMGVGRFDNHFTELFGR